MVQEEISITSHTSKRKKSKLKKEKHQVEDEQIQSQEKDEAEMSEQRSKKEHKKKKHKIRDEELDVVTQEENLSLEEQPIDTDNDNILKSKKKKSKKKKLDKSSDDEQSETLRVVALSKNHKQRNSENKTDHVDTQNVKRQTNVVNDAVDVTKLKKRHKGGHAEVDAADDQQITDDKETSKKLKKRKKPNNEISDNITKTETEEESTTKKKKRKESKDKGCSDEKGDSSKTAVSELQEKHEIKESPAAKSEQDNVVQGQWQGSLFDNSDRQNKFLRLMGGMKAASQQNKTSEPAKKKGLFGSLVPSSGSSLVSGNSALSASAAADLNRKLEEEYNKAMNFKLTAKKGSGFGFAPDPAEGKTFHIDVFKTKSIQFDD